MPIQGHPRSLILVPIDSAYTTSCQSSIVTLVLFCPVSDMLQFSALKSDPTNIPPEFLGCSPGLDCRCCGSEERRHQANYYSCNQFGTSPTYMPTVPQRYRRTEGRTDGRLTITIPRFALCASRGKNQSFLSFVELFSPTICRTFEKAISLQLLCCKLTETLKF